METNRSAVEERKLSLNHFNFVISFDFLPSLLLSLPLPPSSRIAFSLCNCFCFCLALFDFCFALVANFSPAIVRCLSNCCLTVNLHATLTHTHTHTTAHIHVFWSRLICKLNFAFVLANLFALSQNLYANRAGFEFCCLVLCWQLKPNLNRIADCWKRGRGREREREQCCRRVGVEKCVKQIVAYLFGPAHQLFNCFDIS